MGYATLKIKYVAIVENLTTMQQFADPQQIIEARLKQDFQVQEVRIIKTDSKISGDRIIITETPNPQDKILTNALNLTGRAAKINNRNLPNRTLKIKHTHQTKILTRATTIGIGHLQTKIDQTIQTTNRDSGGRTATTNRITNRTMPTCRQKNQNANRLCVRRNTRTQTNCPTKI